MSKGFITGTNEELIKAYKESRDESYLKELIEANKGLINLLVSPYLTSIPNSELLLKTVKSRKCRDLTECRSFIIMIWRSWSILENRYMRQGWYEVYDKRGHGLL